MKVVTIPVKRNELLIRFENLADLFDYPSGNIIDTNVYVDVRAYAEDLFAQANYQNHLLNYVNIRETGSSGIEFVENIRNLKRTFKVENDQYAPVSLPSDKPGYNIALPAQAIRVFHITYVPLV